MSNFNEHSLEMAIMEMFEQQGYSYVNGETIHKELSEEAQCIRYCIYPVRRVRQMHLLKN